MCIRDRAKGANLEFALGYSHSITVEPPAGISFVVEAPTRFSVQGIDKQQVGEVAANIRKLPEYAFIEPRMVYNHNDFHPPFGSRKESDVNGEEIRDSAYSDGRDGDALIHDIYDAIRTSATPDGSNAINTLLLITFDAVSYTHLDVYKRQSFHSSQYISVKRTEK